MNRRQRAKVLYAYRLLWLGVAWICVALATLGAVLPLLPTTPFLLVAAWAAPKGSPRLAVWLHSHPRFGPPLRAWQQQRAVSQRAKTVAGIMMAASWLTLWLIGSATLVLVLTGTLFLTVGAFLLSRPIPKTEGEKP